MADSKTFAASIQDILTRGLDVAERVVLSRYQVNDPTPAIAAPNGAVSPAGQPAPTALAGGGVSGVPPWAWYAGAALLAVVVLVPLLRK